MFDYRVFAQVLWRDSVALFLRWGFWLLLAVWVFLTAFMYFAYLDDFIAIQPQLRAKNSPYGVTDIVIIPYIKTLGLLGILILTALVSRAFYEELWAPFGAYFRALHLPVTGIVAAKSVQLFWIVAIIVWVIALPILVSGLFFTYDMRRVLLVLLALSGLLWVIGLLTIWLSQLLSHSVLVVLVAVSCLTMTELAVRLVTSPEWLLPILAFFSPIAHFNQMANGVMMRSSIVFLMVFTLLMWVLIHRCFSNRYLFVR
ncbi:hypothetical protein [Ostreibacterium oceani]|uniref:Uncharacterized protein n=1 Tax=Ostreibacterium oceani TaxID=2654998 RepID=A0A6N7EX21_9GAMM|nr:hypothetical protein [Ostreibacterium oceani]MPV86125.1 hypothetical protein [Ostreibacterium oceani]